MTTPTQAQIEAAARAIYEASGRTKDWQEIATAALTAAAEAGENEIEKLRRQRIEFDCRYTMGNVADLTGNHCPIDKPCLRCQNERLEARTIERCAQVAENFNAAGKPIAAAIRAMKEEP